VGSIGQAPWTRRQIHDGLDEFADVYGRRPLAVNSGGMRAPHMLALWVMLRSLEPDLVVESGVWKGQGTWLIEQACPQSQIVCLDPVPESRLYTSSRATYLTGDFDTLALTDVTDRSVAFFDDHQNAYRRLQQAHWAGFRHVIFEDNYPPGRGDCYSLWQVMAGVGFAPERGRGPKGRLKHWLQRRACRSDIVPATEGHAKLLGRMLEVYAEFPPLVRPTRTRWGDEWSLEKYPTAEPLLALPVEEQYREMANEGEYYTWMCYARIRSQSVT
jgi:hypothetical protein